ncbi:hypothetical protein D1007_13373 [Hordeum vulgare]|nr:hypothetical protein D1007_13373 [Hordeum vulgare]
MCPTPNSRVSSLSIANTRVLKGCLRIDTSSSHLLHMYIYLRINKNMTNRQFTFIQSRFTLTRYQHALEWSDFTIGLVFKQKWPKANDFCVTRSSCSDRGMLVRYSAYSVGWIKARGGFMIRGVITARLAVAERHACMHQEISWQMQICCLLVIKSGSPIWQNHERLHPWQELQEANNAATCIGNP